MTIGMGIVCILAVTYLLHLAHFGNEKTFLFRFGKELKNLIKSKLFLKIEAKKRSGLKLFLECVLSKRHTFTIPI